MQGHTKEPSVFSHIVFIGQTDGLAHSLMLLQTTPLPL
jgi:hypothetical protein